ncbi:hypothetical protein COE15_24735 [Bacillus cereus]|uniref:hypothetical protein n=1 Tax=unclassified Bacillus (in: firmicutes) TaxID=185979 RepID=UPI00047C0DAC|nr:MULTISPECIES: hypothetical protein [unclassified Bacillus (in: firmicutes)]PFE03136.1 hypothetical protein CN288_13915 [Bacillus sp. AFS023182]PGX92204.1 hypothetical protein COE15_24735 [Bacillus cereus]
MLKDKMKSILKERKIKALNDDYGIQECWKKITDTLSENESETIQYLKQCDKEDLYWISEVFEDISEILQSPQFITCLRTLDKTFPELDLTHDIDIAESYLVKE